jgi:hypothetical protein
VSKAFPQRIKDQSRSVGTVLEYSFGGYKDFSIHFHRTYISLHSESFAFHNSHSSLEALYPQSVLRLYTRHILCMNSHTYYDLGGVPGAFGAAGAPGAFGAAGAPGALGALGAPGAAGAPAGGASIASDALQKGQVFGTIPPIDCNVFPHSGHAAGPALTSLGLKHMVITSGDLSWL